jgi:hypothetical protein
VNRPAVRRRAWALAITHIPFFELTFRPIRDAILAAIEQALSESPPKDASHDS